MIQACHALYNFRVRLMSIGACALVASVHVRGWWSYPLNCIGLYVCNEWHQIDAAHNLVLCVAS